MIVGVANVLTRVFNQLVGLIQSQIEEPLKNLFLVASESVVAICQFSKLFSVAGFGDISATLDAAHKALVGAHVHQLLILKLFHEVPNVD